MSFSFPRLKSYIGNISETQPDQSLRNRHIWVHPFIANRAAWQYLLPPLNNGVPSCISIDQSKLILLGVLNFTIITTLYSVYYYFCNWEFRWPNMSQWEQLFYEEDFLACNFTLKSIRQFIITEYQMIFHFYRQMSTRFLLVNMIKVVWESP